MNPSKVLAPPLVQVAKMGHAGYLKQLLNHGCTINQQTDDGICALHLAVQHKVFTTAESLVTQLCE